MSSINAIMSMGARALLTQQKAQEITGHNIANVDTPGFSRQRLQLGTNVPVNDVAGQTGTGVSAQATVRVFDQFVADQINTANQAYGSWASRRDALQRVEMVFDESSGFGLNSAMSGFWNAWQDLSNNPSGAAERVALVGKTETMTTAFNTIATDLEQLQTDIDRTLQGHVDQINSIGEQIADLNQKISLAQASGQNPNDFKDTRAGLLETLSGVLSFNGFEAADGQVNVLLDGGRPLVQNSTAYGLSLQSENGGSQDLVWLDSKGDPTSLGTTVSQGQIAGLLAVRDQLIPAYQDQLDQLAAAIIAGVNDLHADGYAADGTQHPFFNGTAAADMTVNPDLAADVNKIACAQETPPAAGDNRTALAIVELQQQLCMQDGNTTFDDFYNALVSRVGVDVQTAVANSEHQADVVAQLTTYRESVAGVSLDEEMVNLLKYQHAYEAAAKLISTVDDMIATLIGMV